MEPLNEVPMTSCASRLAIPNKLFLWNKFITTVSKKIIYWILYNWETPLLFEWSIIFTTSNYYQLVMIRVIDYFYNFEVSTTRDDWSDRLFLSTSNYYQLVMIGVINYLCDFKVLTTRDDWSDELFLSTSNYYQLLIIGAIDYFYDFKLLSTRDDWSDRLFCKLQSISNSWLSERSIIFRLRSIINSWLSERSII